MSDTQAEERAGQRQIVLWATPELCDYLDRYAKAWGMSRTRFMTHVLFPRFIDQNDQDLEEREQSARRFGLL